MWGATASASASLTPTLPNTGRFTFYQHFWQHPLQLEDFIQLGNTALGEVGMTFPVSKEMREQDPLRRMISEVAGQLLNDESLTRRERVVAEGILDGTWRLAPNGSYISSEKEKQSQPSATGCAWARRVPWKAQMTDDRDPLRQYDKDPAGRRVLVGLSAKETRVWDFLSGKDLSGHLTVEEERLYEFLLTKHDRARAGRWDK